MLPLLPEGSDFEGPAPVGPRLSLIFAREILRSPSGSWTLPFLAIKAVHSSVLKNCFMKFFQGVCLRRHGAAWGKQLPSWDTTLCQTISACLFRGGSWPSVGVQSHFPKGRFTSTEKPFIPFLQCENPCNQGTNSQLLCILPHGIKGA